MKKVILLLIDSFMPHCLEQALQDRTVPALQFLVERGVYHRNCVTVFPTMTASVDSSLLTGVYPHLHRVPGLIWYDPEEQQIINYINGWKCVHKLGISRCVEQVLYNLNEKHLSRQVTTLFEELERRNKTCASVNTIVHRGGKKHRVRLPLLSDIATGFRFRGEVSGPDVMTLGAVVESEFNRRMDKKVLNMRNLYGINDSYAASATRQMIESGSPPDFMLVYLPDHDHEVHRKNPDCAAESLVKVDRHVQQILSAFPTWEDALKEYVFIVTGDHGQTKIGSTPEFNIDLDHLFQPFKVLQLGERINGHDLVVCNNERMTYVYPLHSGIWQQVIERLVSEPRIDLIAWKEDDGVTVREGGSGRMLRFSPGGSREDMYGMKWHISGDETLLDLKNAGGKIGFGDYPDALSRLYGALYSQNVRQIVITARPRFEFKCRYYPTHMNGGSHGSLHKYDSLVPLIVVGSGLPVPVPPRLVDVKSYVLKLFDGG
jgi:hypothetical protein